MIKRKLLEPLKQHLGHKEISLLVGARQAGKTTLMRVLEQELRTQGQPTLFLNLDIESDRRFFVSQETLLGKIRLELGAAAGYVFIDEIQRKENAGLFLKGIYDSQPTYKFIVSGSGSLELKEKLHESLAGRKRVFQLGTLSFEEFVDFKTGYRYQDRLPTFVSTDIEKSNMYLAEYLSYGGYPRVVLADTQAEKRRVIDEIYQSYLERDIQVLLHVQKKEAFTQLVKILATQVGQLVSYSELASTVGVAQATIKDYLWYLEKTFIVRKVRPFFRNKRKEISKAPIYYFNDLGFRNYAADNFGTVLATQEEGFLFQNAVHQVLHEKTLVSPVRINYWRTKSGAEVDFVINSPQYSLPVEVKYQRLKDATPSRSLQSFIHKYSPKRVYLVNQDLAQTREYSGTQIQALPFPQLLNTTLTL